MSSAATVPSIPDIKVDIIEVNAEGEYSFPTSSKSLLTSIQEHKKAVLISVPGAFTPTCSEKHLPGFIEHFDALSAKGGVALHCSRISSDDNDDDEDDRASPYHIHHMTPTLFLIRT